ncbi:MAG: hypothetical protein ACI9XK_001079 [Granulosicoccus sp.]|jgi:uncharacterized protein with GYD domain
MAVYLIQIAFTAESIANLVEKPENRLESMIPLVEAMGGKFVGSWISFGEYDSTAVIEMPDNTSIKAFELRCMAGGALRFFHVTPLMTFEDGVKAMKQASQIDYKAPA